MLNRRRNGIIRATCHLGNLGLVIITGLVAGTGGCHRTSPNGIADSHLEDAKVLKLLKSGGSDLKKPARIIHYLYFNTNEDASAAASELKAAGYHNVKAAPVPPTSDGASSKPKYSCIAETRSVPSEESVFATTDRMTALAKKHGGNYDGWEASVER